MKKIDPQILAEWEAYRGRTITTTTGVTFDMMDLAQRAYRAAESDCQEFQECIDTFEGRTSDEEYFRGETPYTIENGISAARYKAELFKFKHLAYRQHMYRMGLDAPDVDGWLETMAHLGVGNRQPAASPPLNDNEQDASRKKKPRRKNAGKAA